MEEEYPCVRRGVSGAVLGRIEFVWIGVAVRVGDAERVVGIIMCVCLGVVVLRRQEHILKGNEGVPAPQTTGKGFWREG